MEKGYFLGLDLGTGSLGWAVTDEEYQLMRAHGKTLWGVRLFESANTAEERRGYRTGRRRLNRRNQRLNLLQEIFAEEINRIDDGFFLRMKESRYTAEDKRDKNGLCPKLPYALFVDKDYTDKDYHKQFPTIYHLRKWLMETKETPDVRLVYLALHHMMKHRGHFLFSGEMENIKEFKGTFCQLLESVKTELEIDFEISDMDLERLSQIENILKDRTIGKTDKKKALEKQIKTDTPGKKALMGLLAGGTAKLSDIFDDPELDQSERPKISFSDNGYEDYAPAVESILGEKYLIIEKAKAVYDWSVLVDILGEYGSVSAAKVAVYEKHKQDLQYLKHLVRQQLTKSVYQDIFVKTDDKTANYPAYIGMTKKNGKKCAIAGKQCSKDDFYDYLKKQVISHIEEEKAQYIIKEIETGSFLPKQVTKDNSVLPYQVHLYELNSIINNLKDRVPVLAEQGEKIRAIFTFRIPYYVGPLNGIRRQDKRTNWAVRKQGMTGKIYPWNFDEMIDKEESAEQFIRRMTNKCTYLPKEDVLPKYSLLYSKFTVLNELNNLRLDGELIDVDLKQRIYTELFKRYRKVTQKKLKDYLVREGIKDRSVDITGIDGDFKGSLTAYHDFKEKLTGINLDQTDCENIILNISLFGEDKKLLKKRLSILYPMLTEKQIGSLANLSYKGWGRLSRKFLEEIAAPAPETGEVWSIIRAMWETNDNLMQVLSEKYLFTQAIEEENMEESTDNISYSQVEQLNISPAVKRQIWQTLLVVKELCKVMKNPPERIFVEMARDKQESKRTDSRKKKLLDLYKKCKEEERDWIKEIGNTEEHMLRGDKLYLYYTQKGRCMYSGEVIELEDLWDNRKYDIDHIYPQSKVMDDSLDNRVLVKKTYNAEKTDNYPIHEAIRKAQQPFWKSLLLGGFITKEKYERLTRSTEFEPSELAGFIARQLVETRQSTKAVASILKQVLPDTEIVYVKAKIVSQFRQDFNLTKVREMNDLHHAKDAYLNIVVGNVYYTKFTQNAVRYIRENPGRSYNLKKMFTSQDVERNGKVAWKAGESGTICTVKDIMAKNNILVTRKSYEVKGGLFDQQLMKKGKGQVPIKGTDERLLNIEKYGGYNNATGTYFMLVESDDKKGNKIRTIEYMPLHLVKKLEKEEDVIKYLVSKERGLVNPKILLPKIKKDTLFKVDGFSMWLSGRTGNQLIFKGANQLLLSFEEIAILKKVFKFVTRQKENKNLKLVEHDQLSENDRIKLYDVFLDKIKNTVYQIRLGAQEKTLTEKRDVFLRLSAEEQCLVLSEILHMFQCQSGASNLKLIDGPGNAGKLFLNNNITKYNKVSIINQSPTGIYEQEIDLKKL